MATKPKNYLPACLISGLIVTVILCIGIIGATLIAKTNPTATPSPTMIIQPTKPEDTLTPIKPTRIPSTEVPATRIIAFPTRTETHIPPTPTITITPQPTPTVSLTSTKGPGFYLVNVEIAPGLWRSTGNSNDCYWKLTDRTGEILDNFYGMTGGTMYITADVFQVELHEECGYWEYMGPP